MLPATKISALLTNAKNIQPWSFTRFGRRLRALTLRAAMAAAWLGRHTVWAYHYSYNALQTRLIYAASAKKLRTALCADFCRPERKTLLPALVSKAAADPTVSSSASRAAPAAKRSRFSGLLTGFKRWSLRAFRLIVYMHIVFVATTTLLIVVYKKVDPPFTVLALSRKYFDGWTIQPPQPATLETLPKTLRFMLVAVEDSKFWTHPGFDLEAFRRAAAVNKAIGQPLYGGSTLTMQLARTLFLVPAKSYLRKYLELIIALELELILPKERILELYFSWAEWGKGVFGVEAAALWHYKKPVKNLSVGQMARLIAILSSPIRYGPHEVGKRAILKSRYDFLIKKYGG
ncbi:MAG: transglycosylase domain-containing protein [Spirochaetes bacterium]|nr:transglycosylase domain-containing protein [Spirochaetota bacterium]MBU0955168.1 transglycosylase domain-containing protein [Spirochaetota bacterium]